MIIYVDVVFILNVVLDFLLLMSVSVILTRNISLKRVFLGSIVGGLSMGLLFINTNGLISFILKIILGLLMVLVTFGYKNIKYTFNNLFYLYTLSFSVGGVMYLLMDSYYNYIILILGFIIVLFLYIKQIKQYQISYSNYYKTKIIIKDKEYTLTGYLDTGNKLNDPYKHRPVVIINKKIKYNLEDVIYVPINTINNSSILKCIKVDKIIINKHVFRNYLVGLSNKKIDIDGINCILHSKMKGMIS